jgi:hypothetical protein
MSSIKENSNFDLVLGPGEFCSNSKLLLLGVGIVGFFGVLLYAAGYDEKYRVHGIEGGLGLILLSVVTYVYFLSIFMTVKVAETYIEFERKIFSKITLHKYNISELQEIRFSLLGDLILVFPNMRPIRVSKMLMRQDREPTGDSIIDLKNLLEGKISPKLHR